MQNTNETTFIDAAASDAAINVIDNMTGSVLFLKELLGMRKCSGQDASVHMQLLRYGYDQLAGAFGCDVLNAQLEEYEKDLREANARIRELEAQLGGETTTDAAIGRIKELQTRFETWYKLTGFKYGSIDWLQNGFSVDFSYDVDLPDEKDRTAVDFGSRELAVRIERFVPYVFTKDAYDLKKDSFHNHLTDTDKNRKALRMLFENTFPGSRIAKTEGHYDRDGFLLHVTVHVPYSGIDAWYDGVMDKLKENPPRNAGRLYARRAEIARRLNSKNFMDYAPAKEVEKIRKEKPFVDKVTFLWDSLGNVPVNPETGRIETEWTAVWETDGRTRTVSFPAGTSMDDVCGWFEEVFHISVDKDLKGV